MSVSNRPLAIVTGASSGIGYALAKECARNGFDLVLAADERATLTSRSNFGRRAAQAVHADLATLAGVDKLYDATSGRSIDALLANAGHGLGHAFLDQNFDEVRHVVDTNITGTIYLLQRVGRTWAPRVEAAS